MPQPRRGQRRLVTLPPAIEAEIRRCASSLGITPSELVEIAAAWVNRPRPSEGVEPARPAIQIALRASQAWAVIDGTDGQAAFPGLSFAERFRAFWQAVKESPEFARIGLDAETN